MSDKSQDHSIKGILWVHTAISTFIADKISASEMSLWMCVSNEGHLSALE